MAVLEQPWGGRTRAGDSSRDLHKRGGDILAWGAEEEVDIAGLQIKAVRTHTLAAGAPMEGVWPTKPAPGNTQHCGEAKGSVWDIGSMCSSRLSSYKEHSNEVGTGSNKRGPVRRYSWYRPVKTAPRAESRKGGGRYEK